MRFLAVTAVFWALQDPEKSFELKFKRPPVEGLREEFTADIIKKNKLVIRAKEQKVDEKQNAESYSFQGTDEVLKVGGEKPCLTRRTLTRATKTVDGKESQLAFVNKSVLVTIDEDGTRGYRYEGGDELTPEETTDLHQSFLGGAPKPKREKGETSGTEAFMPGKPVKVGESWDVDLKAAIKSSAGPGRELTIDETRSKGRMTLVRVETRDGIEFGRVEGCFELAITRMGNLELDTPLVYKVTATLDVAIDGKHGDGVGTFVIEFKGTADFRKVGADKAKTLTMDMDVFGSAKHTVKTVK